MRFTLSLVLSILVVVGIVAFSFTIYQSRSERERLENDIFSHTGKIASDLVASGIPATINRDNIDRISDSLNARYNILGMTIYTNDSMFSNHATANYAEETPDHVEESIAADSMMGDFFSNNRQCIYRHIAPLKYDGLSHAALILYADAEYIENIIENIWLRSFFRWFMQVLLVCAVTLLILRLGIFTPINKIVEWVKAARSGNIEKLNQHPPAKFLEPLHNEIVQIAKAMHDAKASAEEEARLRTQGEAIWTPERLRQEIENLLGGKKIFVVSNREPYMHIHDGRQIKCIVPASGMVTAMEPILQACSGLWIASGSGDADKETVDENDKLAVPPDQPKYTLKRIWLSKEEEDHYYYGFSNEGLWPLCHIAHTRPVFRKEDWEYYQSVNEKYAQAVLEEIKYEVSPMILIQDYHFALLPEMIKRRRPDSRIAIFWHIPWPNRESFSICPWQKEILGGMLGADLIGFHTQYYCNHFLETVNATLESKVSWDNFSVQLKEHTTLVKPFPISIDLTTKEAESNGHVPPDELLRSYNIHTKYMGVGVDRIDYTKGIVEKFLAVESFLEKYPEYIGKFTFVQIGAPSRTFIKTYSDTVSAVENEANRINGKFKLKNWKPILLMKRHHSHEEIHPFYASADFCMVNSLHDGMNLVAKEFIATREHDGVLILSQFAGAANELQGALIVNPYDIDKSADAIREALEMPKDEQGKRMRHMRQTIVSNNIYAWAASLIRTMNSI